jgi:hypothetical protein
MATNKTFLILLGLFLIGAGSLGFANGVGAETLNLRATNVATKIEIFPVGNVEGYGIGYAVRDGVFASDR